MQVSFVYKDGEGFDSDDGKETVKITYSQGGDPNRHSPTELLLLAIGGCTSDDVLSILHKMRQDVKSYRCVVEGEKRSEHPRILKFANVSYIINGDVDPDKARRAIHLSLKKYCSVSIMAERGGVSVSYSLVLNGKPIDDRVSVEDIGELEETK
ncbi:hypothetical protein [Thermoplasma volcanium GSS1]|uniref:Uncharacterized protein n=1 Tax=Thermoplasma volcanium (strain ATCC 51530 / DSM 4299 / JCM 9571 / NBRC 15438 / GSS1) TaxID=273116 RepID=Q978F8_THEVO|nr:OsmC family protein [Thermoplasma volcanium]BAB60599.1 hypothetical protein [Thermoplasma volcanium GSS1]